MVDIEKIADALSGITRNEWQKLENAINQYFYKSTEKIPIKNNALLNQVLAKRFNAKTNQDKEV